MAHGEKTTAVTWLLTVRNGMPYLPLTLASVEAQTVQPHLMLVSDGGSTDGTVEELRRWIPDRIPGKVITDQPMPIGPSRTALVEMARSEYCAWTDADDLSHPQRIEKQLAYMRAHPKTILVGSQIQVIDAEGRPIDDSAHRWDAPVSDAEVRWATRWRPKNLQPAWMFHRDYVVASGSYRDLVAEDTDLLMRLSLLGPMPNLPEPLLQYRKHGNNVSIGQNKRIFAQAAKLNARLLFPGLKDEDALKLWRLAEEPMNEEPASFSDLRLLRRGLRAFARTARMDEAYFRDTELYRHQEYWLKHRCLKSSGLGPLIEFKQKMQRSWSRRTA